MAYISDEDRGILKDIFNNRLDGEVTMALFVRRDTKSCKEAKKLLEEVQFLSDKIKLEVYDFLKDRAMMEKHEVERAPATALIGKKDYGIRYYGVPTEQEFESLIKGIIYVSKGTTELGNTTKEALSELQNPAKILILVTSTCLHCPRVVELGWQFAIEGDLISTDVIDIREFPEIKKEHRVLATPKVVIPDKGAIAGSRASEVSLLELIVGNLKP